MAISNALARIAITPLNFLRMALAKQSFAHIAEWKRLCLNPARRESLTGFKSSQAHYRTGGFHRKPQTKH